LTTTLKGILVKILDSLIKQNSLQNIEVDFAKNVDYVLPWNATSDWEIYENIMFHLLKNTKNFGKLVEVQMRYVSLEERNFTQLRLPDLFKTDEHQAPNENLTNMMGYLLTRIKVKATDQPSNLMK